MPAPFVHELRVRYGECDPQGIVFNANYLLYFDVAFAELWRAAVGPWQDMVTRGVLDMRDIASPTAGFGFRAESGSGYSQVIGVLSFSSSPSDSRCLSC